MNPSILTPELAALQHQWLRGARARLLRAARIAHREAVLELGAGHGMAAEELADRCGHPITAVDVCEQLVGEMQQSCGESVRAVCADACDLPFEDHAFDLVFAQFAFLWFADPDRALDEACRVLRPGGALVAIEPDYEAMIEYPLDLGLRQLWVSGIEAAGACPHIGRRLAAGTATRGLTIDVLLPERLVPFDAVSTEFLAPLLGSGQARALANIVQRFKDNQILVHLPLILLYGQQPQQ